MNNHFDNNLLRIDATHTKKRLDHFLKEQFSDRSRSELQKEIKNGTFLINNKVVPPHYFLKKGDILQIKNKGQNEKKQTLTIPATLPVLFEDDHLLVIDKPAGLVVHPTKGTAAPTLVHWLKNRYPDIAAVGENPERPGMVHRLDKEVSGVMIIAKTPEAFAYIKKQFQERTIQKTYCAVVQGVMEQDEGTIDFPIHRSEQEARMAALPRGSTNGKPAETRYEVLQRFTHFTLLHLFPKTGRTHQIRVHLFAIGHPIVGDPLYKLKKEKQSLMSSRILLHATALTFTDLAGKKQTIESPLPKAFENSLSSLGI